MFTYTETENNSKVKLHISCEFQYVSDSAENVIHRFVLSWFHHQLFLTQSHQQAFAATSDFVVCLKDFITTQKIKTD